MPIRSSSRNEIDSLIGDLGSDDDVKRDAAVARLTVIGARAVGRLTALANDPHAHTNTRAAAFQALEAMKDPAALDVALRGVDDPNETVAIAAIAVVRAFLRGARGAEATDRLASAALDARRASAVRLAAIGALRELEPATVAPLLSRLRQDPRPEIAAAGTARGDGDMSAVLNPRESLMNAAVGTLPDDPAVLRRAIVQTGRDLPVAALQKIIDRIREHEGAEPAARRPAWGAARAAAHLALARRGSRVALYDLRETIESAKGPVAVEFIAAIAEIGDVSCLEALAAALARARTGKADDWWRTHFADAFRTIVAREGITRRHALMKKIEKRFANVLGEVWAR